MNSEVIAWKLLVLLLDFILAEIVCDSGDSRVQILRRRSRFFEDTSSALAVETRTCACSVLSGPRCPRVVLGLKFSRSGHALERRSTAHSTIRCDFTTFVKTPVKYLQFRYSKKVSIEYLSLYIPCGSVRGQYPDEHTSSE